MNDLAPDHAKRVAYFRSFLRAGGVVSYEWWTRLAAPDMAALVEAGAAVQAERAVLIAEAIVRSAQEQQPVADPLEIAARLAMRR